MTSHDINTHIPGIPHQRPAGGRLRQVGLWLILFGISMGYFEAAVVADLRAIFCPDDRLFPLCLADNRLGMVELGREFFSLVMLVAVAALAGWDSRTRIACFFILFGIWDIFYYLFLKLILDWPESLLTWDLLFLLPVPWVAPVIAPVLISLTFIAGGFLVLWKSARGMAWQAKRWHGPGFLLAAGIMVVSFCLDWRHMAAGGLPRSFPWSIFWAGELLLISVFIFFYYGSTFARSAAERKASHEPNR